MQALESLVLVIATLATVWLVYYVRFYLPARLDERFKESLKAFSTAIELRFPAQAGSSNRVVALGLATGRHLGLHAAPLRDLEMASILRDIGLCAIPYSLINGKSSSDWSEAERLTYDRHPEVSGAMLELVPSLCHVAPIVRLHHIPFEGVQPADPTIPIGELMPVEARILRVVTEYILLERNLGDMLARQAIREGMGTLYCPVCSTALLGVLTSARAGEVESYVTAARS